jgi:hypothetical protein
MPSTRLFDDPSKTLGIAGRIIRSALSLNRRRVAFPCIIRSRLDILYKGFHTVQVMGICAHSDTMSESRLN